MANAVVITGDVQANDKSIGIHLFIDDIVIYSFVRTVQDKSQALTEIENILIEAFKHLFNGVLTNLTD